MLLTRHAARAVSLRRRALVQHAVRPRRHHHRAPDPVDRPGASPAACSRYLAATQASAEDAEQRRRAGQDPARDARGRDGGAGRGAVRPLLRQRRRDAAVRHARRRVLRAHRRPANSSESIWPHVERALDVDRPLRRPRRRRLRRVRARRPRRPASTRAGRTRTTRSSTPTARLAERPDRAVRGAGLRLRCAHGAAPRSPRALGDGRAAPS